MKSNDVRLAQLLLADVLAGPGIDRARIGVCTMYQDGVTGIPVVKLEVVDDPRIQRPAAPEEILEHLTPDAESIDRETTVLDHGRLVRRTCSLTDLRGDAVSGWRNVRVEVSDYIRNPDPAWCACKDGSATDVSHRVDGCAPRRPVETVHAPILAGTGA